MPPLTQPQPQQTQPNIITKLSQVIYLKEKEFIALSIYPITILLGQLIYHSQTEITTNYYTNKHNFLNVFFVKKGWFWTVITTLFIIIQHGKSIKNSLVRLGIQTIWWWFFTQWFFGVPLMDKVFVWTGGVCDYDFIQHGVLDGMGSSICRQVKGHWKGGHDPSGHVFLLVLGSLTLWFEILSIDSWKEVQRFRLEFVRTESLLEKLKLVVNNSVILGGVLLWLWWWMLLTTSIHFHSFLEQISGLIFGSLGVLVYTIPRMF
ncbi:putative membrane protein [Wickerhamomyces ciferrii]|uniref:Acyl-coenzyme A diphosphatase SCS3 n=1 Tax=Wickerhamomyces ciferrii (strain ATCC 14091 / BCRC 22168 / CBS 111 / JCM 3599 / NBRC 0793 / NRRL Y-1031 F-60-10) TaxID=1206466 RepID=K0KV43_WICCF|nr:uncharacterized protein BN7_4871 [Wickerhamomyces ciferrii]CCH45289.1 putative membrane protein [Wickerhamomyces ciferrii]